jgi:hypothetical protein
MAQQAASRRVGLCPYTIHTSTGRSDGMEEGILLRCFTFPRHSKEVGRGGWQKVYALHDSFSENTKYPICALQGGEWRAKEKAIHDGPLRELAN